MELHSRFYVHDPGGPVRDVVCAAFGAGYSWLRSSPTQAGDSGSVLAGALGNQMAVVDDDAILTDPGGSVLAPRRRAAGGSTACCEADDDHRRVLAVVIFLQAR